MALCLLYAYHPTLVLASHVPFFFLIFFASIIVEMNLLRIFVSLLCFTGQIAANEALKKDLEGIIIGLQEYLESVKSQARQTSDECKGLKKEKKTLLQRLEELEDERNQLEIIAMDSDNLKKVSLKKNYSQGCYN